VRPATAPAKADARTTAPIEPEATPEPIESRPVAAALEPELVPDPPTTN
jgi:hypothetical protein